MNEDECFSSDSLASREEQEELLSLAAFDLLLALYKRAAYESLQLATAELPPALDNEPSLGTEAN